MANIIFYTGITVAVVSLIFAAVIVMRYQMHQIRYCMQLQKELTSAFELLEKAHEATFDALKTTEKLIKEIIETSQSHDELLTAFRSDLDWVDRSIENLQNEIEDLNTASRIQDDLK